MPYISDSESAHSIPNRSTGPEQAPRRAESASPARQNNNTDVILKPSAGRSLRRRKHGREGEDEGAPAKRTRAEKKEKGDGKDDKMEPEPIPHLPPEIWLMILECLPPSFFQQDLGRLTVCKRWYRLAFPAFYRRIECTPKVISRLVHGKSGSLDRCRALLRKSLRCVNIVLRGLGPAPADTRADLARFCAMLLEFGGLKTVRFAARWENPGWRADPWHSRYLDVRILEPYLGILTHVTSLDLDLCGTDVVDSYSGVPVHFCPSIRPLLARLRSLRLRMRSICQVALCPLEKKQPLSLGELRLSLYLGKVSDGNPKLNCTRACVSPGSGWKWTSPADEMRARMRLLVQAMVEPRRAEMVHLAPSGEVHVWSAATDMCVRDRTETLRRFPSFWGHGSDRPCFSGAADELIWRELRVNED